ncbi:MAG TPA: membrane protein insertase YidC [Blastocatellia bacterium]|nr:membrane protein insertase YidC [Blastocatellia bacterium]
MDRARVVLAIALSSIVLIGWQFAARYFSPPKPAPRQEAAERQPAQNSPAQNSNSNPVAQNTAAQNKPGQNQAAAATAQAQTAPVARPTAAPPREIIVDTPYWTATFTSRGAVATSWILKQYPTKRGDRAVTAANYGHLELVPQGVSADSDIGAPFKVHVGDDLELTNHVNRANFAIEGVAEGEQHITLQPGERREITFRYLDSNVEARKTFAFDASRLVFDVTARIMSAGSQQPISLQIGPRVGDQSDHHTGSYSTPPQVVAFDRAGHRTSVVAASINDPITEITAVDRANNTIALDDPAFGLKRIKLVASDEITFLGYANIVESSPDGRALTLDSLPEGTVPGASIAPVKDVLRQGYQWAGDVDHYFAMVAIPSQAVPEIAFMNLHTRVPDVDVVARDYQSVLVPVDSERATRLFVGPKDRELLASTGREFGTDFEALIDYGMFSFIIRPIVPVIGWALDGLAKLFHNYGWSIVVVTIVINLALSPLRWYSSKKMKKAAKHQPRMKELQDKIKKLKDNPKKHERELTQLQQEQMALMKEANPLGGCLPLVLQMPIFWAFFVYLTISLDVRHAPWILWVKDLSTPDPYKILPIVMCVTMIASTKLTPQPATADPSMKMQRVMMTWFMPIMLTWFFFLNAPSGLVLYWMVSNLVGVIIQLVINKVTAEPAPSTGGPSDGKKAGGVSKQGDAPRKRKASGKEVVEVVK